MGNLALLTTEGVPFLNGLDHDLDYEVWEVRMVDYLLALDVDMWRSILNVEKSELSEKAHKIIMKGISKPNADKVRHCESAKEVLDILQCLYGGDNHVAKEKAEESCSSSNELEYGEVVAYHTRVDDECV